MTVSAAKDFFGSASVGNTALRKASSISDLGSVFKNAHYGQLNTFDQATAANRSHYHSTDEGVSHLSNNPWVQSLLTQALNNIAQGKTSAGMRLLYSGIEKSLKTSPQDAQELLAYFCYELEQHDYEDLSDIIGEIFGEEPNPFSDAKFSPSSTETYTDLYDSLSLNNEDAHDVDERASKAKFIKDNRSTIEEELEKQRKLSYPVPKFLGLA